LLLSSLAELLSPPLAAAALFAAVQVGGGETNVQIFKTDI